MTGGKGCQRGGEVAMSAAGKGVLPIVLLLVLAGCQTAKATGAVAGAAGGAVVSSATAGARATGAVVGAAGGAIVGSAVDRNTNANKCFERSVEVPCPPQ